MNDMQKNRIVLKAISRIENLLNIEHPTGAEVAEITECRLLLEFLSK